MGHKGGKELSNGSGFGSKTLGNVAACKPEVCVFHGGTFQLANQGTESIAAQGTELALSSYLQQVALQQVNSSIEHLISTCVCL